jgi:hypothetical protein
MKRKKKTGKEEGKEIPKRPRLRQIIILDREILNPINLQIWVC